MFGELGLNDVLKKLKRADDSLTEFVAPLWPGVRLVAAWMEKGPRLFHLDAVPETAGYYLLGTEGDQARGIRPADADEQERYRDYLEKASVILLPQDLAFPASFAERLQGITAPRPIHFADAKLLSRVIARFDGLNLFFDHAGGERKESPLSVLFGEDSIFTPGELLGIPGQEDAGSGAAAANQELEKYPEKAIEYRLRAVVESAGAILDEWNREDQGIRVHWRRLDDSRTVVLPCEWSPITSGICLPGARGIDMPSVTRLLLDHALDAWRE